MKMDLELIPIRLRLSALVTLEINLFFGKIKKVLFKFNIWSYEAAKISKNIIDVSTKEKDESPPQFSSVVSKVTNR